ncbi:MAG: M20/M25/M40 family metallo-hydrolase [Thermodesulfobacteriota bacterium]
MHFDESIVFDKEEKEMKEVVDLTQDLIRFKSVHANQVKIRKCADFIESYLGRNEIPYRRMDHEGLPSILAGSRSGDAPVLLMSHIDVVDGPDALFNPRIEGEILYGRGSIDDKYAAAVSLVLLKEHTVRLKKAGKNQEQAKFSVLITGDEEIGGHNGAKKMLAHVNPDFCIALDGGNVAEIITKEKGLFTLKLTAHGIAAHGSRPWMGKNAIENLIGDFAEIKNFFSLDSEDHWHRTMSLNIIHAGNSFNQVPDFAEAVFDIRYTEHDDMDALLEEIRPKISGTLSVVAREPLFISGESPFIRLLQEVSPESRLTFEHGASDARFLSEVGIPAVVWGADGDQSAHSADEHVHIPSIYRLYGRLAAFMEKVDAAKER